MRSAPRVDGAAQRRAANAQFEARAHPKCTAALPRRGPAEATPALRPLPLTTIARLLLSAVRYTWEERNTYIERTSEGRKKDVAWNSGRLMRRREEDWGGTKSLYRLWGGRRRTKGKAV